MLKATKEGGERQGSFWTSENDCSRTGSLSEENKHMQLYLAFHLAMFIHFIWAGERSQADASCIKFKSLKNWTVKFWGKVHFRWQENGTDSLNYEVQSSWTVTACFWEEIINVQPEARKCIGRAENRESGTSQNTGLSRLGRRTAIQWTVCRRGVNRLTKLLFHFPSGLTKFYPYVYVTRKKIGLVSHL